MCWFITFAVAATAPEPDVRPHRELSVVPFTNRGGGHDHGPQTRAYTFGGGCCCHLYGDPTEGTSTSGAARAGRPASKRMSVHATAPDNSTGFDPSVSRLLAAVAHTCGRTTVIAHFATGPVDSDRFELVGTCRHSIDDFERSAASAAPDMLHIIDAARASGAPRPKRRPRRAR